MNRRTPLLLTLVTGLLMSGAAYAYAPESDLMELKGYSPEVVKVAEKQRSRQEWRQPQAGTLTPMKRFFHNVYYGKWTEGFDEFGSQVIRD